MNKREMAKRAHKSVLHMANQTEKGKLKTLCKRTPGLMCHSGLAQTVVFLRSRDRPNRGEKHGTIYLEQLIKVMAREGITSIDQLQKRALEASVVEYIALTSDAQRAAEWLRRFAQIEMVKVEEEDDRDE